MYATGAVRNGLAVVVLLSCTGALARQSSSPPKGPLGALRTWWQYNSSTPADERMGLYEYVRFRRTGAAPARLQPATVLEKKTGRARRALSTLRSKTGLSRYMVRGFGERVAAFMDSFYTFNTFTEKFSDARLYALRNQLDTASADALARDAVEAMHWHVTTTFTLRGFGPPDFYQAYARAKANYEMLRDNLR